MTKFKRTASAIGQVKQENGFRIVGQAFLGDGNGNIVADKSNRLANYWEPAPGGELRIVSTAYLWVGSQIPFENISSSKLVVVDIGYPPNDDRVHILWQNGASGISATGGYTLNEQKTQAAAYQPVKDIPDWRAGVNGGEIFVATGMYIDDNGDEQKWYGGNTGAAATSLATRIAALTSGQHQLCWVTFDLTNGILVTEAAAAVTAVGTLPSRNEFLDADYTVSTTNRKLIPVYLYYGQTLAEADIIRKWDMRWPIMVPGAGSSGANTALSNLASVAVNTSIISDTDVTDDLGSTSIRWNYAYAKSYVGDVVATRVKNTSGSTANANHVGYITYTAASGAEYKTTTTANFDAAWCVVIVGGANNADIYVATSGVVTVELNANCSADDFLTTSTTAGRAAVNTLMRPEVFAVALTANAGGAGGTCTARLYCNTVPRVITTDKLVWAVFNSSSTAFVATINGAPSATSVTYNAPSSGNENTIVPLNFSGGREELRMRLWNTTRGTARLITAVNTTTNVITTLSTSDAWASGDTITIESQTVASGLTNKFIDLDFSDTTLFPTMTRSLLLGGWFKDSGASLQTLQVHPFETYASPKFVPVISQVANVSIDQVVAPIKVISGVITVSMTASGSGTASGYLHSPIQVFEAVP